MSQRIEQLKGLVQFWERQVEITRAELERTEDSLEHARANLQQAQEAENGGEWADAMKITITGVAELSEVDQQRIGRQILLVLYSEGFKVDGVKVEFEKDNMCEVQDCSAEVTHDVDGDQLCAEHFHEHWADK